MQEAWAAAAAARAEWCQQPARECRSEVMVAMEVQEGQQEQQEYQSAVQAYLLVLAVELALLALVDLAMVSREGLRGRVIAQERAQ